MKQGVRNFRALVSVLALFSLLTFGASMLYSQTATSGVVIGTVADATGALIRGATVTIVETATNHTLTATTDSGGRYIFPVVAPGEYTLTIVAKGFRKTTVNKLVVEVNKSATVDQTLTVGAATEVVEVTASGMTELQTTDSSVGEVLSGTELNRLPVQGRSAAQLIFYQPGVSPDIGTGTGSGDIYGGQMAGARSEQNSITVDGGDATSDMEGSNNYASPSQESGAFSPVVPVPQDAIEEFRVATNNSNATFGASSGGQISMVTKSGTNSFHGSAYNYHSDDGLDANGWNNNAYGVIRPKAVDNRFGAGFGGPIIKDKLFFYGFYEGRRFHDLTEVDRIVPTDSLKNGYISFYDDDHILHQENFNPANGPLSTDCPAENGYGGACDPRALGISPVIMAQLALLPKGNNPSEGDFTNSNMVGMVGNTEGLTEPVPTPISTNMGKLKLNGTISNKWSAFASWQYSSTARTGSEQVSLLGSKPSSTSGDPYFANFFTFQLQGQLSPTFLSVTHGSFLKNWWGWTRMSPTPFVPGSDYAMQIAGEDPGTSADFSAFGKLFADPVNINTQQARARTWDGHDWYIAQEFTKIAGAHTFQFGGEGRLWHDYHIRTDQVLGGLTTGPETYVGSNNLAQYIYATVGNAYTPTSLDPAYAPYWDGYYASILGMVDHSTQVEVRNGAFQPYPLGTPSNAHVTLPMFNLYFQDVWKLRKNLTVTAGLNWGVVLSPSEQNGKESVLVYADSNTPVNTQQWFKSRAAALESGGTYNPLLGISPVDSLASPFNGKMRQSFWKNIGPRISVAWEVTPTTVLRGGYSLVFDRTSAQTSVLSGLLAGGLADVDTCGGPVGNGGGPAICSGNLTDPTSAFRIGPSAQGWDGSSVTLPAPVANPIPLIPQGFSLSRSYGADAYLTPGYAHVIDLNVQHSFPHKLFLEVGYIGRFSRNLAADEQLDAPDLKQLDLASGQRYAPAFDALSNAFLAGTTAAIQPFFENQMNAAAAGCTPNSPTNSCTAVAQGLFNSDVAAPGQFWLFDIYMNLFGLYTNPTTNSQVELLQQTTDGGRSNYNAAVITLRKAISHGLQWQANYTWSHAIGTQGTNQQYIYSNGDPYNYGLDYASEPFDHRHTLTGTWYYDLPFGKGKTFNTSSGVLDRIIGGWSYSGIFNFFTGSPDCAYSSAGNYGAVTTVNYQCATPIGSIPKWGKHYVNGALNVFPNGTAEYSNFTYPQLTSALTPGFRNSEDQMRTFAFWNFDMSLGKKIPITERVAFSINADAFNIFNHVIFATPFTDITSPATFGAITSQFASGITAYNFNNGGRTLQIGARIDF
jgi:hypothetical protein